MWYLMVSYGAASLLRQGSFVGPKEGPAGQQGRRLLADRPTDPALRRVGTSFGFRCLKRALSVSDAGMLGCRGKRRYKNDVSAVITNDCDSPWCNH